MNSEAVLALIIALAQSAPAAFLLAVADRLEPNPLIGFRLAYTLSSRRVWRRANRLAALLLLAAGVASLPIGLFAGPGWQAAALALADIAIVAALSEYSRRLLELEQIVEPAPEAPPTPAAEIGAVEKALILAFLAASLVVEGLACLSLYREGLPGAAVVLAAPAAISAYVAFLSLARPEAYERPWLRPGEVRFIVVALPVALSLLAASTGLAVTGPTKLAVLLMAVSLAVVALVAAVSLRRYAEWASSGAASP